MKGGMVCKVRQDRTGVLDGSRMGSMAEKPRWQVRETGRRDEGGGGGR